MITSLLTRVLARTHITVAGSTGLQLLLTPYSAYRNVGGRRIFLRTVEISREIILSFVPKQGSTGAGQRLERKAHNLHSYKLRLDD